jgi:hypothetical protein
MIEILMAAAPMTLVLGEPVEDLVKQADVHLATCRDIVADNPRGAPEDWSVELGRRIGEDASEELGGAEMVMYRRELVVACYAYWTGLLNARR